MVWGPEEEMGDTWGPSPRNTGGWVHCMAGGRFHTLAVRVMAALPRSTRSTRQEDLWWLTAPLPPALPVLFLPPQGWVHKLTLCTATFFAL